MPLCGFMACAIYVGAWSFPLILAVLFFSIVFFILFRRKLSFIKAQYTIRRQDFLEQANILESDIEKEWQSVRAIQKKLVDYGQLKNVAEKLNDSFTVYDASKILSTEVSRLFGQKDITVILYLFHSKTGELGISASQKGQMDVNLKAKKGDLYDKWIAKNMHALLIEDTKNDFRFDMEKAHTEDSRIIRSLMSVPMMVGNKAIGILRLDSSRSNYFLPENVRLLTTIADLGAVAIENAQLYEKIEDLAIRDGLTGLFLRRHFLKRLSHELKRDRRKKSPLSFLMFDLDYFKKYNDKYGHMAGDIVLKTLSMMLMDVFCSPGDMICRYGGEEFAVFLPDCSQDQARKLAEELRKRIAGQSIMFRRQKTNVSISVGIAVFPDHADVKDDLIEKADMALYKAKDKGRNRVCVADK